MDALDEESARRVDFRSAAGRRIAADAWGHPDAQPVLFLHGGGQTRHAWGGTARAVAAHGYLAVSMDHRGHGESDWDPDGDYTSAGFVGDLRAVIDQLARPAGLLPVLVGASLGGITAMEAEAQSAEPLCRALVLVDITPRLEVVGVRRIIGFMAARPDGFASLDEAADFIAAYLPHRPRPRDLSGLQKNLRRGDDGRYRWHWDPRLMRRWKPDLLPEEFEALVSERLAMARRLRVPVLLVRGRSSDVVSEAGAREFLDLVPHAEYVDLEAAGHMVAGDRNDAFTSAVVDFVRRVVPSGAS